MPKMKLYSSLIASVLFIALLIAPLWFADYVETGELDDWGLGHSLEEFLGAESASDLDPLNLKEENPAAVTNSNYMTECGVSDVISKRGSTGSITNLTTNLTIFGDHYASIVIEDADICDSDMFTIAGKDYSASVYYFNWSVEEVVEAEAFRFVIHPDVNATYSYAEVQFVEIDDTTGAINKAAVLSDRLQNEGVEAGVVNDFPVTTQKRLLLDNAFADEAPTGYSHRLRLIAFAVFDDLPSTGEVVVYDAELSKERSGMLSNTGKLIAFNVGYVLIGGLLVVIATPWISFADIFGGGRPGRRGSQSSIGIIAVVGLLVLGGAFIFAGGSFQTFLAGSLLPFSLAALGVAVIALTTRGKSNRSMTWALAGLAGVFGYLLGQSIQSNWLPYDALYVAQFGSVLTGGASLTSAFALSAFFVVVVQIAGTLVALYNIAATISTDETATAVR